MNLNIPVKLESYLEQIKNQTRFIKEQDKLTLLQMGKSVSGDVYKTMFLIYNPYPISISIDCNSFTKESKVYKLYPGNFIVAPNTAAAFVSFTSEDVEVYINENNIINTLRKSVATRIVKLSRTKMDEIDINRIYSVNHLGFETDKTIELSKFANNGVEDFSFINYDAKFSDLVDVSLSRINSLDDNVELKLLFENKDLSNNLKIRGFRLKITDKTQKMIIDTKQPFNLRANTKKMTTLLIEKTEFQKLDFENLEFKVTVM